MSSTLALTLGLVLTAIVLAGLPPTHSGHVTFTHKNATYVAVPEPASYTEAVASCANHVALPGPGSLITLEALTPLFFELYAMDKQLADGLLVKVVEATKRAPIYQEHYGLWLFDSYRACLGGLNNFSGFYAAIMENAMVTTDLPCQWRLCYICTEERSAKAMGVPVSTPWLTRYQESLLKPSPYRLGPAASGLRLVSSDLVIGDPVPPASAVAFDESEQFWRDGPVVSALYRGGSHDLYALKPLHEGDGVDGWALTRNQSAISGYYGVYQPQRDGGSVWEMYNTPPGDYIVKVQGCFKGPVVERLFFNTRTGRQYQLARGGCTTQFTENAPEGGYLAGFAGRYLNTSLWPPGPPPYAEDIIFIRQLQLIWAAPTNSSDLPMYSVQPAHVVEGRPSCPTARRPVIGGVNQLPGSCGGLEGNVCPSHQCCAGTAGGATQGTCGTGLINCQVNCASGGYSICGTIPEKPAMLFVNMAAAAAAAAINGPTAYLLADQVLTYKEAVNYCRTSTYMGLSWHMINISDIFGLTASVDVRRAAYLSLTGVRFWVFMRNDSSGPAGFPCFIGAYGIPHGKAAYPHTFIPVSCLATSSIVCKASVAQQSNSSLRGEASNVGSNRHWAAGAHTLYLSKRLGAGPFGSSCSFSLLSTVSSTGSGLWVGGSQFIISNRSDYLDATTAAGGGPSQAVDMVVMQQPLSTISISLGVSISYETDSTEQVAGLRLELPGNSSNTMPTAGAVSSGGWHTFQLAPGEVVTAVSGCAGGYVERLVFHTSTGRLWTTPFTRASICSVPFLETAPPGAYLVGLQGYVGWYLEAVQLVWGQPLPPPPAPSQQIWADRGTPSNVALIAGLAVAGGVILLVVLILSACFSRHRTNLRQQTEGQKESGCRSARDDPCPEPSSQQDKRHTITSGITHNLPLAEHQLLCGDDNAAGAHTSVSCDSIRGGESVAARVPSPAGSSVYDEDLLPTANSSVQIAHQLSSRPWGVAAELLKQHQAMGTIRQNGNTDSYSFRFQAPSYLSETSAAHTTAPVENHAVPASAGTSMHVVLIPPDPAFSDAECSGGDNGLLRVVLGRDVIVDENSFLGRGASGTVRQGVLKLANGAGVPVAVKLLEGMTDYVTATAHIKALAAEVHVLSRLDHPNVLKFYGCSFTPPRPFIVEELMATPLNRIIHAKDQDGRPSHPYDLIDVLVMAQDIASGLAYLHPTVVHRDLKPGNVLLDESGVLKIGDFGLARFKSTTQLSTTNLEVGTTVYCAPEVFTPGEAKITDRCDVWALGMLIYEMVTRRRPWEGTRNAVIGYLVAIERRRPPLPEPEHPLCPPALCSLIERCWRHNPEERPASAEILKLLTLMLAEYGVKGGSSHARRNI